MSSSSAQEPAPPASSAAAVARRLNLSVVTSGRVVLIGLGGIGLPLTRTVATFLAGVCNAAPDGPEIQMVLCDGDTFSEDNAYRMDCPGLGNKAQVLAGELLERIDSDRLHIRWIGDYATDQNIDSLIQNGDCVLLACDNHATRHLVGRHAATEVQEAVLISGGNDGVEEGLRGTYGNVQVHIRRGGRDVTAPLERFHPEIATPADRSPHQLSCLELVQAGVPQISFVNLAVASAMCNALLRLMMSCAGDAMYDEVSLDVLEAVSTPHWLSSTAE